METYRHYTVIKWLLLETVFPLIFFDSKKMKNLLMNRSDIYEIIALLYNVFDWKIISKCDPLVAFEIRWFFFYSFNRKLIEMK